MTAKTSEEAGDSDVYDEADAPEIIPTSHVSQCERFDDQQIRRKRNLCEYHILWEMFKGLFYTFVGCLCIAWLNVIVKKAEILDTGGLSMIRHVGMCFGSLPLVIYKKKHIFGKKGKRILFLSRAIIGSFSLHLVFLSCRLLQLAEAVVIMSSAPTVTMILAKILLKEPCGRISVSVMVITFSGVVLSTRIPAIIAEEGFSTTLDANHLLGLASAFGFVLTFSITIILQRKIKDIHYSVVIFSIGFVGIIQNAAITAAFGSFFLPRWGVQRVLLIVIAVLGFSAQYFRTTAMNTEAAATFALMKSCFDIIMAILMQIIFFTTYPDVYTICGGVLVLFSIGIISFNKMRR